jgi:hypothetical protein
MTLLPGQTEYVDVVSINELRHPVTQQKHRKPRFSVLEQSSRLRGTMKSDPIDQQVLRVAVLSTNASAKSAELRLPTREEYDLLPLEELKLSYRPLGPFGAPEDSWHTP